MHGHGHTVTMWAVAAYAPKSPKKGFTVLRSVDVAELSLLCVMVPNPSPYQSSLPLAGLEVLLVEHESVAAFVVEDMLFDLGAATVWHAADVKAALALLRDRQPGVAVVDISLAGETADPIAERLKAAGIPAVFVAGYGRDGLRRRWSDCVAVQKPFRPTVLAGALRTALDGGRMPRSV